MILYIDTTQEHELEIALYAYNGERKDDLIVCVERDKREQLLKSLDYLLSHVTGESVTGIVVVNGPQGRFSAIRRGVICANALAWSWDIPVVGVQEGESIQDALSYCAMHKHFDKNVVPVYAKSPV